MSKLAPLQPVSSEESYRPISPLAIVGLGLGLLSVVTWFDFPWLLLFLPLPGLIISMIARRRIRHSEGTLAGEWVAAAGIALCLINGLGWVTMHLTKGEIIRREAKQFAEGWFAKLRESKEPAAEAFLDTVSPRDRQVNLDPDDMLKSLRGSFPPNQYVNFRNSPLPSLLLRHGEAVKWTPRGMREWDYQQGGYRVEYRYQVETPEYQPMDVILVLRTVEVTGPKGRRREWMVDLNQSRFAAEPAPNERGREMAQAATAAQETLKKWVDLLATGKRDEALAMTTLDDTHSGFNELFKAIGGRGGIQAMAALPLADPLKNARPQVELHSLLDAGPHVIEYQATFKKEIAEGQDPLEVKGWRVTHFKYLGKVSKPEPQQ